MLIAQTLDKLNAMKLGAMADACQHQLRTDEAAALGFEERFGLLVAAEWAAREQRKLDRRLRTAKLRHPATLEAVDFTHPRRLKPPAGPDAAHLRVGRRTPQLDRHRGVRHRQELPRVRVRRTRLPPRLHRPLRPHAEPPPRARRRPRRRLLARVLARLTTFDLLAIDDWMIAPLRDAERRDLTEVIEDRAERASTLIASQLPVTDWHAVIGDPNQADAICDRLLQRRASHRAEGPLNATDTPRSEDSLRGDEMSQVLNDLVSARPVPGLPSRPSPPFPGPLRNGAGQHGWR